MDTSVVVAGFLLAVLLVYGAQFFWPRPQIVRENQRALRFRKGRLLGELGPGRYWIRPRVEELAILDVRRRQVVVAGQEVLTADRVPLKVSLICEFTVASVSKALTQVEKYEEALYGRVQLALREVVAAKDLDAALEDRGDLGSAITERVTAPVLEFGLELHSVQVRDFMLAAGLRNAYADVIQAKQQGLAALERARGESAAIRNLANSAELMERHPGIMHLRLLQAVESGSGNRIVIALDPDRSRTHEIEVVAEGDA